MIHMGGIIGVIISQGRVRRLIRCAPGWLRVRLETAALTFRNARDRRDFMAAGVAGGVAAAFGAPVGGLLFVAEELATHWDVSLGMQVGRAHVGSTRAATFDLCSAQGGASTPSTAAAAAAVLVGVSRCFSARLRRVRRTSF
jgi:H+/Cl- antiporter ClcA